MFNLLIVYLFQVEFGQISLKITIRLKFNLFEIPLKEAEVDRVVVPQRLGQFLLFCCFYSSESISYF